MATIKTKFTLGDTIEFTDVDGEWRRETVKLIETQLVEGFGLWVMYGYGDLYKPRYVSEHYILKSKTRKACTIQ
ncbi:hypothetical protein NC796_02180 [Aliifodinibius sp. S!AR15-10]|uniref:hypothetical protein n=1 Tax=Aliifodinibius sp. S!AR15-10 TaxID=2950437 RepID=UPI00285C5F78|nr:hypothetical protein [Aliifodinibius sp. S!AR15-10]MDR8389928.1 hypothetical protein [Aliifodinibius sp. S!AR15-10]